MHASNCCYYYLQPIAEYNKAEHIRRLSSIFMTFSLRSWKTSGALHLKVSHDKSELFALCSVGMFALHGQYEPLYIRMELDLVSYLDLHQSQYNYIPGQSAASKIVLSRRLTCKFRCSILFTSTV